ncbi:hypothetical protein BGZ60DRAFT_394641, partial [Tricladium varicosporioides]
MDDLEDSSSETSNTILDGPNFDEAPITAHEIIEDLTAEESVSPDDQEIPIPTSAKDAAPVVRPRSYQYEMLEESLKRNIIVAMDTGSGKTQV